MPRERIEARTLVVFDRGDEVVVQAGDNGIRFLLVSGQPIEEPVAWYGPIVMNTEEELDRAFEDYRASMTVDLEHDGADRDRKIGVPTLVLWGGNRMAQSADMLATWRERCERVEGHAIPECGHFLPEEQPGAVLDAECGQAGRAVRLLGVCGVDEAGRGPIAGPGSPGFCSWSGAGYSGCCRCFASAMCT